jgi:hypothetical protein
MVSLLDISPVKETVSVHGQDVEVTGVSAEGIAYLLGKFPQVKDALMGKGLEVTPQALLEQGPTFVAAIIAAGTGAPGNAEVEKIAAGLAVGVQVEFIDKIIKLTLPGGVGPFVDRLQQMLGAAEGSVAGGKGRGTNSQPPSKG